MSEQDKNQQSHEYRFALRGMHCASCVQQVQSALDQLEGIDKAEVNLPDRSASVSAAVAPEKV
ncbi:cation transporter, partial [Oceanospirillum sp. HFRX-1_2]